jgi:hypothetical protein
MFPLLREEREKGGFLSSESRKTREASSPLERRD